MQTPIPANELQQFTHEQRRGKAIVWYRSPLPPGALKELQQRSDWQGLVQTGGYLGILIATGTSAFYSANHWPWFLTLGLVFLHGTGFAFLLNGVHELGHGTVFRTKGLNTFFVHLLAFFGWTNHEIFQNSHARHHRYTLHPPDDLEVVLPSRLMIQHFFRDGFFNARGLAYAMKETWRIAQGRFAGEWEMTLYPPDKPEKRIAPVRWAWVLLIGHTTLVTISVIMGWWMLPLLTTLAPAYGSWLFWLCNNTQHIGLQDNVSDFRLCCRTFTVNPIVRFLYWQMNYHIEHHMYAAVPCYHLKRLHELIKADLPACPNGLIAVWREIGGILARQQREPGYQHQVPLPPEVLPN